MRVVAQQTVTFLKWHMLDGTAPFKGGAFVALGAQCPLLQRNTEGIGRIGRVVTAVTTGGGNRIVHAAFEQLWLIRGVRVVAYSAVFLVDRVVAVRLLEGGTTLVVAVQAKFWHLRGEQVVVIRAVGHMTGTAPFVGEHLVHDLLFKYRFLMALEAGFVPS